MPRIDHDRLEDNDVRTHPWRVLALLLALSLVAAACGDSDDDASSDTAEADTTEADTSETAADTTEAGASDTAADTTEAADEPSTAAVEEAATDDDWPTEITFAAVPAEQDAQLQESYSITLDILQDELGLDSIEFFQAADYAGVIEAMIAGNVDVAQFGPFSYVIASANGADIQPAGVMVNEAGGQPGYRSYGLTQAGNDEIDSIEDFAGRNVCFVDPGSTSGFLYPSAGLLDAGIDPETGVTGTFAGGHDASAISVANGTCEAGFAFDTMVTSNLIDSGDLTGVIDTVEDENVNEDDAAVKIVWKSEVIAGSPMAIQNSLPQSFIDAFVETVTTKVNEDWAIENGYCASADDCTFSDEDIYGYVVGDDSFYDGVREVCRLTQAAECEGVG